MWEEEENMVTLKEKALQICRKFLAGPWKDTSLDKFQFSKVSGGLSNRLYLCSLPPNHRRKNSLWPSEVLLRVHGLKRDRDTEEYTEEVIQDNVVYTLLAEKELGPKLYGVFADGRLEQFIPSITLNSDNMRRLSLSTAREMARIHALQVPISKDPDIFIQYANGWLDYLENNFTTYEEPNSSLTKLVTKTLRHEYEWMRDMICTVDSPVVFCHNDLQGGNILLCQDVENKCEENKIILIDFEFSVYNYRGFDIANHFCEWCFDYNTPDPPHFEYDSTKFPSEDEQNSYIEIYLEELRKHNLEETINVKEEKKKIQKEISIFKAFAHLYWTIWSFKSYITPGIEFTFDFKAHAEDRYQAYANFKQELIKVKCINDI